jgi:hypothetical protein
VFRRRLASGAIVSVFAAALMFVSTTTAVASTPLTSLDGLITDQIGAIEDVSAVERAQADFEAATGHRFYVVFADSWSGLNAQDWATTTASSAGLASADILLAVSPSEAPDGYWLQHGDGLQFTSAQETSLVNTMDTQLSAGLDGSTTWSAAVVNIINAFQHEVPAAVTTGTTGTETATPPAGAVQDEEAATSGGMPTWLRVILIVLGVAVGLFALWLLLGKFNEKRLAKQAAENPFGNLPPIS